MKSQINININEFLWKNNYYTKQKISEMSDILHFCKSVKFKLREVECLCPLKYSMCCNISF